MRHYLVQGHILAVGGNRPFRGVATLEPHEVMDFSTLQKVEDQLLAEARALWEELPEGVRSRSPKPKDCQVGSFQPFETPASAPAQKPVDVQLNDCGTVLPPVDSPLIIEIAPGVLLRATRPAHVQQRNELLMFDLEAGGMYIGRPRWTHA